MAQSETQSKAHVEGSKETVLSIEYVEYRLLYQTLQDLERDDKDLEEAMNLNLMKAKHPVMSGLLQKYRPEKCRRRLDLDDLLERVKSVLRLRCLQLLEAMTGSESGARDADSGLELSKALDSEMERFKVEAELMDTTETTLRNNYNKLLKVYHQYLHLVKRYTEDYKLKFKLPYENMKANFMCSKIQALCIKNRLEETETVLNKYGDETIIAEQNRKRLHLEREDKQLNAELKEARELRAKYESLDKDKLKEYLAVKNDLECKQWAAQELDQSGDTTSQFST